LAEVAIRRQGRRSGLLIGTINDQRASEHFVAPFLKDAGFTDTAYGFQMRRVLSIALDSSGESTEENEDSNAESA
jgi:hypothetical protein